MMDLTTLVRDCSVSGVQRRVLLLRADLLPPRLSREHHLRLAYEALDPLTGADRARRYDLTHGRLAISWRGEAPDRLRQALDSLEHLLMDAPLDAPTMPELARLFDLPKDGAALIAVAHTAPPNSPDAAEALAVEAPPRPPLDLATLELIESRLVTANVARFARRRAVCRLGASFSIAWETRFLHVEELMATLCPGRNPYAEPWLFRRLTRMLDRRMLALLSSPPELRQAGPFSLNLNVGGVLSPEFLRFDAGLPANLRGHTVLDLHPADVMSDIPAFRFAAAFARARGHRIMLRGITPPLLALLDLPSLDLDFVELRWSPSLAGLDLAQLRAGAARWVLARAADDDAIRWGAGVGIGLFQGDVAQPGVATAAGLARPRAAA
jgi:hypothetical protein